MKKLKDMTPLELGIVWGRSSGSRVDRIYREILRRCFEEENG